MTHKNTTVDEKTDEIVLEAFLHLFGEHHAFREVFHSDNIKDAKDYVERMLEHKHEYETPDGEWRDIPGTDGIMYWPGDPSLDTEGAELSDTVSNPTSTKGYIIRKPIRTSASEALDAQPHNPQHFRTESEGSKAKRMVRSVVGLE